MIHPLYDDIYIYICGAWGTADVLYPRENWSLWREMHARHITPLFSISVGFGQAALTHSSKVLTPSDDLFLT